MGSPRRRWVVALIPAQRRAEAVAHYRLLEAIRAVVKPGMNCVDVGAYAGDVLAVMVAASPQGQHIAWEPLPYLARRLKRRFPTVDIRSSALSDSAGDMAFVHVRSRPSYSGLRERTYPGRESLATFTVRVDRLDDSLPPGYVPHVIKVDVEGAELQVLRGGVKTLQQHQPYVFFEHGVGGADHYGTNRQDLFDFLTGQCGMRVSDINGAKPFSKDEFLAVNDRSDFLASR